ncbi:AMP-binding protein [Actinocrispum wychmicini]|uniref:Phenylacetate-CoA ligase n=1 Tax=Actinocrispum wychmicini TaxID=1213861 RepID=A0A4R2J3J2_9PSEU|nr:AMP-binding protein [Actinocrispum wychmicini]TCO53063.1 phenylacetate-CoA ligase [Actinocrispum wychmicini]
MRDYPVPDYVPMAATALTDSERWPLLTDAGRAMLTRLREHPHAPHYNHACGDRLTQASVDRLRSYQDTLRAGQHGWTPTQEPPWVDELIAKVHATVPRYRRRSVPQRLTDVPTIGRHDLLSQADQHVPDDADLSDLIVYDTSGSRGPAARVPMSPEFTSLDLPVIEHVLARFGVRLDGGADRVSLVNVYHQPVAYQFVSVMSYLGGAGLLKINLHPSGWTAPDHRVSFLDSCVPELYTGNPISLATLAELPLRHTPKAVISGAMALSGALRQRLEERFQCPVVDLYGITETGLIAWRDQDVHRIVPRRLYVEILDESGRRCAPGVVGEITVTCGENPMLPLLRYRTGDHAALEWRDGPVLLGLDGRAPVMFRGANGTLVNSIEVTHVLSPLGLVAWHLHQRADGSFTLSVHHIGAPDVDTIAAAFTSLLGDVPVTVTLDDLARDAKPQRYTSDLG